MKDVQRTRPPDRSVGKYVQSLLATWSWQLRDGKTRLTGWSGFFFPETPWRQHTPNWHARTCRWGGDKLVKKLMLGGGAAVKHFISILLSQLQWTLFLYIYSLYWLVWGGRKAGHKIHTPNTRHKHFHVSPTHMGAVHFQRYQGINRLHLHLHQNSTGGI